MKNLFKKSNYIIAAFVSAVSLFTIALGNTNVLAQNTCINADCVPTSNPAPAKPVVSLTASPTSLPSSGSTTLSWTSQNITSCTASGGWTGTKAASGSQTISGLKISTTFTLKCSGPGGEVTGSVSVSVTPDNPKPTLTLKASSNSVTYGGTSILSWSAANVTSCLASNGWAGAKTVPTGSETSTQLYTPTTFTLKCSGPSGEVSSSVSVSVQPNISVSLLSAQSIGSLPFESRLIKTNECALYLFLFFGPCVAFETDRVVGSYRLSLVRSGDVSKPATVGWRLDPTGSPAITVIDDLQSSSSGSLYFAANSKSASMLINAKNDWKYESEKEFFNACIDPTRTTGVYVGTSQLCTSSYVRDDDGPCEDNAVSKVGWMVQLGCVIALDTVALTVVIPATVASVAVLGVLAIAEFLLTGDASGVQKALTNIAASLNTFSEKVRRAATAFLDSPSFFSLPLF